jgi:thiol-disulfide isomerase/thioredoxin
MRSPIFHWTKAAITGWLFVLVLSVAVFAQRPAVTAPVVVKLVDEIAFKKLIVPNGKPLLINFWATWCDPCREEFPDLVKLDNEYKGKIDFITISLDDPEDIAVAVPKFLASMKAEMPAYLLKTADESAVIASVSKDWQGGMPFTILLNAKGETAYFRQGKINPETVRAEINKIIAENGLKNKVSSNQIVDLPISERLVFSYEKGLEQAKQDFSAKKYTIKIYGLTPAIPQEHLAKLKAKYDIEVNSMGCFVPTGYELYAKGYNEIMKFELSKKYGRDVLQWISF